MLNFLGDDEILGTMIQNDWIPPFYFCSILGEWYTMVI